MKNIHCRVLDNCGIHYGVLDNCSITFGQWILIVDIPSRLSCDKSLKNIKDSQTNVGKMFLISILVKMDIGWQVGVCRKENDNISCSQGNLTIDHMKSIFISHACKVRVAIKYTPRGGCWSQVQVWNTYSDVTSAQFESAHFFSPFTNHLTKAEKRFLSPQCKKTLTIEGISWKNRFQLSGGDCTSTHHGKRIQLGSVDWTLHLSAL